MKKDMFCLFVVLIKANTNATVAFNYKMVYKGLVHMSFILIIWTSIGHLLKRCRLVDRDG